MEALRQSVKGRSKAAALRTLIPDQEIEIRPGPPQGAQGGLMELTLETFVGAAAALCTTASYIPQLRKCWTTGETGDLSLKMLLLLACGLGLWMVYGLMRGDAVIILANGVSLALLGCILYFKLRESHGRGAPHRQKA